MCLIALAYKITADLELLVLANRDEFTARPAAPLHIWPPSDSVEHGSLAAGQDLQAGGTWMGIARFDGSRRFAAVTNYRNPDQTPATLSRGALVSDFLAGSRQAPVFVDALSRTAMGYGGFNLLLLDHNGLYYCSNRWPRDDNTTGYQFHQRKLTGGIYVLSNHLLDSPWPKSLRLRGQLSQQLEQRKSAEAINPQTLLDLMLDTTQADTADLPVTGLSMDIEQQLSSVFIRLPGYGTRCSTLVSIADDPALPMLISERRFGPAGIEGSTTLNI